MPSPRRWWVSLKSEGESLDWPCHISVMTTGHLFLVAHPRESGPLHVTYAVAGSDRQATEDILLAGLDDLDAKLAYARALSAKEIEKLGLKIDEYRSIWPTEEL